MDLNLVAYMAVTAHWIKEAHDTSGSKLVLCLALIGFHLVPKCHEGMELAHILFDVVEQVQILGNMSD